MARTATTTSRIGLNVPADARSVVFNGTTQKITFANSTSIQGGGTVLVMLFWYFPTTTTGVLTPIDKSQSGTTNSYYMLQSGPQLLLFFDIGGISKNLLTSEQRLIANEWNLCGFHYQGSLLRTVMFNSNFQGLSTTSVAATGVVGTNNSPLTIGATTAGTAGTFITGKVYRPVLYTSTLLVSTMADIYKNFNYPTGGLSMDIRMTEGSGTSVADSSGNGNTGTLIANSWSTSVPRIPRSVASSRSAITIPRVSVS